MSDPVFFPSADAFRAWLAAHHDTATELLVREHKVGSGRPSMTWSESVDEALCFGWITFRRGPAGRPHRRAPVGRARIGS